MEHHGGDVVILTNDPPLLISPDYSRIQSEFSLCKPPSSAQDIHQLNGLLRMAFTTMAMLDYPYSTHFMGNMPANPVKVTAQQSAEITPMSEHLWLYCLIPFRKWTEFFYIQPSQVIQTKLLFTPQGPKKPTGQSR